MVLRVSHVHKRKYRYNICFTSAVLASPDAPLPFFKYCRVWVQHLTCWPPTGITGSLFRPKCPCGTAQHHFDACKTMCRAGRHKKGKFACHATIAWKSTAAAADPAKSPHHTSSSVRGKHGAAYPSRRLSLICNWTRVPIATGPIVCSWTQ